MVEIQAREKKYQQAMNQGHSAAWDQKWEQAVMHYRTAVEALPEKSQAINNLGLAYFQLQKYGEAQACYEQAAKMLPGDPLPIERLAQIHERVGNISAAAEQSMNAADIYLKLKDADKAIENWARITRLVPEHLKAHSRLAVVHERLGFVDQAVTEYISVAALLQDIGQINQAVQTVEKAVSIAPDNLEAQQALELVRNNKTLPKPIRKRGATGPLRMAAVREMGGEMPHEITNISREGPDPIAEARQSALTALAGLLFDVSMDDMSAVDSTARGAARSILGKSNSDDLAAISKHLGTAIDLQTRAEEQAAAKELQKAVDAGLEFPAAYFNLGLLYRNLGDNDLAQGNLSRSLNHRDYAVAARLMIAQYLRERDRLMDATVEYLEALKEADSAVVPPEKSEELREQYEPLIEALGQDEDEAKLNQLCDNIIDMLIRPSWRTHVTTARQQLPAPIDGIALMPLADMLTEAKDTEIVAAIARINQMARDGHLRSAMEESYGLVTSAPTYLPLHIHMGELLLRQNQIPEAIAKFTVIASTYAVRGEAKRATNLLRRIVEIAPMDFGSRKRLIDRLSSQGEVDQAIHEFIKLADVHYRLAQLDQARKTYEDALRLAQQTNADQSWSTRILKHMADIDMQRLDWRQAMRVYEQLRTLAPGDQDSRKRLIELNVNLGQRNQAATELENYISYLTGIARVEDAILFLEGLVSETADLALARVRLAELYQQVNRTQDAIVQWDKVAEIMVERKDIERAKEAIRAILLLNPQNADQYRSALQRLG
ncbi:MAG: tetratricopeptide repeat protein [Chloroflexota bacterium]